MNSMCIGGFEEDESGGMGREYYGQECVEKDCKGAKAHQAEWQV